MPICHVCVSAKPTCYAVMWSYGGICVGCGCCSKDPLKRAKARMEYHREWLKHWMNPDPDIFLDDPEMRAIQEENIAENLKHDLKKYHYYEARVKTLEAKKKEVEA